MSCKKSCIIDSLMRTRQIKFDMLEMKEIDSPQNGVLIKRIEIDCWLIYINNNGDFLGLLICEEVSSSTSNLQKLLQE